MEDVVPHGEKTPQIVLHCAHTMLSGRAAVVVALVLAALVVGGAMVRADAHTAMPSNVGGTASWRCGRLFRRRRGQEPFTQPAAAAPLAPLAPGTFDAYLINLERSADRLAAFQRTYAQTDLARVAPRLERAEAVDGSALSDAQLEALVAPAALAEMRSAQARGGRRASHRELTPGAVGCYLSHENVWRRVAEGSKPYALVFEDDTALPADTYAQLQLQLRSGIPGDWDVLLLSCLCRDSRGACSEALYHDITDFWRLHAYAISRAGAAKILAELGSRRIEQQLDAELSAMASCGKLRVYCVVADIAQQDWGFATTIQTPAEAERFALDKRVPEACNWSVKQPRGAPV